MDSVEDVCETCLEKTVRDFAVHYARRFGDAPTGKLTRTVIVSINLVPIWMRSGYFFKRWGAIGLGSERAGAKNAFRHGISWAAMPDEMDRNVPFTGVSHAVPFAVYSFVSDGINSVRFKNSDTDKNFIYDTYRRLSAVPTPYSRGKVASFLGNKTAPSWGCLHLPI
jgi:hypothetical protein